MLRELLRLRRLRFQEWAYSILGVPSPSSACARCGVLLRDHRLSTCRSFVPKSMKIHP